MCHSIHNCAVLKQRKENPQLTVRAVARNLGISAPTFYNWQKAANQNDGDVLHRGSGNFDSDEAKEIAHLKKELKNSEDALLILKKAMGILAREEQK